MLTSKQFASLLIKNLDYNKFQTMLLTAPFSAVQMRMIWIGMLGCYLLPHNRCLVLILLCIPPLVGNLLLMKLPLSASWGLIVSSWLVSRTQLSTTNDLDSNKDW